MKSKKKWWILSGVLVVLLAVGIGLPCPGRRWTGF